MARFFIDRPVFAIVLAIIITLLGTIAGFSLPIAQYPNITKPRISVNTNYVGASADIVEKAVAQTKVLNLASNVFSFIVFAFSGNILWLLGITMAIAQIIGARLGAAMVVKKEVHFVKKVFLIAVFASICKLIYDLVK